MSFIRTVKGDVPIESLGLMLPHEHLFVDLRGPLAEGYGQGEPQAVSDLLQPYLDHAQALGVTALVDCGPIGVGRNIAVLRHLANITPIHIIAPTGIYKEAFIPPDKFGHTAKQLAAEWINEITTGIDGSESRAGFIKVAVSDDGPTPLEVRNLQAAVLASRSTGATVGCHTIGGAAALRNLDVLEAAGHDMRRFIWIHAHTEPDIRIHIEAARRGIYLEFDAIGAVNWHPQDKLLQSVLALLEAGWVDHILLSHDAGWYEPGQPGGVPAGGFRGYTALVESFIPQLRANGISETVIHQLTVTNPARAMAFLPVPP
ncbi:MAG TPA: hypothetical protein PLQ56_21555 [Aggregatilineales bacterium]|nr:hypothetical protein [Aggregatilineales bacterium]